VGPSSSKDKSYRKKKSSVMKDDRSSSAEDVRDDDDYNGAQQRNQRSPRPHRKSPSPQPDSSSDEEEEEERRSSRRREKTRGTMQVEPTDFPGQNVELTRVHTGQTACTPSSMAAQQEEDNGRKERRKKSSLDTVAHTTVDASARSVSGRATAQRAEERTAMEEELSALQLIPEKDLQSPTITSRQKGCL